RDALVARLAHEAHDLGIVAPDIEVRMDEEVAEPLPECLVAVVVERLVAEEDHEMVEKRLTDFRDRVVIHAGGDVDPADFRADGAGEGLHGNPLELSHGWRSRL